MDRLDIYDVFPIGFREYLNNYGWNFSKKLCEFASSRHEKNGLQRKRSAHNTLLE